MSELVKIGEATFDLERCSVATQRQYRIAKLTAEAAVKLGKSSTSPTTRDRSHQAHLEFEQAEAAVVDELGVNALLRNTPPRRLMPDGSVHPQKGK